MTARKPLSEVNPLKRAAVLEEDLRRVRVAYEEACDTIAALHAAAVGEVRPPIRGLVEDVVDALAALREEKLRLAEIIAQLTAERDRLKVEIELASARINELVTVLPTDFYDALDSE